MQLDGKFTVELAGTVLWKYGKLPAYEPLSLPLLKQNIWQPIQMSPPCNTRCQTIVLPHLTQIDCDHWATEALYNRMESSQLPQRRLSYGNSQKLAAHWPCVLKWNIRLPNQMSPGGNTRYQIIFLKLAVATELRQDGKFIAVRAVSVPWEFTEIGCSLTLCLCHWSNRIFDSPIWCRCRVTSDVR